MRELLIGIVIALICSSCVAQGVGEANPANIGGLGLPGPSGSFGAPPGHGQGNIIAQPVSVNKPPIFIVIPLFRASPQLIGYALGADDEIWDEGGGSGGGSSGGYGGSSSGSGNGSSSRGGGSSRGGSSRSGGGSRGGGSSRGGQSRSGY